MHYTPKFREAFERVQRVVTEQGPDAGKVAFRDEMCKLGHEERVRNLYRVKDKRSKKAVFFKLNAPQEQFLKTKNRRNIILKCRQVGFTTFNGVRSLDYALWEPNSTSGILCHKLGTVKTIFNDIIKFSYNWFERDWGSLYAPVQKSDSATSLSFEHDGLGKPLESSILVLFDFRGKTVHFLHISEASRVETDRLVGSLNGVPETGEVTLESTAAGRAGEFYRFWQLWRTKGNLAPYKGFFVPWYKHYPEDPESWDFSETPNWTIKELELLEKYPGKITKAHLLWRRWAIEANCGGQEVTFENEYPTNDLDCFISNDASVFPSSIIKMHEKNVREPVFVGNLIKSGKTLEPLEDVKGCVSIWEEPDPSHTYVMGADPSGGVGQDMGAAYVKDLKTGKLVARLWGDLVPADFAKELYKIALFYNKAFICVEANNHGHVVLHVLKELEYRNLYKRKTIDEMTNKPTTKVGFLTSNQSKIMITEQFKSSAKEGKIVILDNDLINEMTSFLQISGKSGSTIRREAAPDAHDDLVMAACLTEEMAVTRPVDLFESEKEPAVLVYDPETGFAIGEVA